MTAEEGLTNQPNMDTAPTVETARAYLNATRTNVQEILSGGYNVMFATHPDADGLCSLIIMLKKYFKHRYPEGISDEQLDTELDNILTVNSSKRDLSSSQLEKLKKYEADFFFSLDHTTRSIDQAKEIHQILYQDDQLGRRMIMIDHHEIIDVETLSQFAKLINTSSGNRLSPLAKDLPNTTTLMQEIAGNASTQWLAAIGRRGDLVEGEYDESISNVADILNILGQVRKTDESEEDLFSIQKELMRMLIRSNSAHDFMELFNEASVRRERLGERFKNIGEFVNTQSTIVGERIQAIKRFELEDASLPPSEEDIKIGPHTYIKEGTFTTQTGSEPIVDYYWI